MSGRVIIGDALESLRKMETGSVNCCVTSPPYYLQRDYGCAGQIGLEATLEKYLERLAEVFGEVFRLLAEDGTLWLNIGDTYCSAQEPGGLLDGEHRAKPREMMMVPFKLAARLSSLGYYLRSDIAWVKPNVMPERVTDRLVRSYEHVFLFGRSAHYHYDREAILEPAAQSSLERLGRKSLSNEHQNIYAYRRRPDAVERAKRGRNKRDVWVEAVSTFRGIDGYTTAAFPPKLIEPAILAGCPKDGVVLDPFLGSGTTGEVANRLGRNWIGIELNPRNEQYILQRTGVSPS